MLKYKYMFQIKYTEAILSNRTRKLLWFEISKMLIAVLKSNFIESFIIIFGRLSFRAVGYLVGVPGLVERATLTARRLNIAVCVCHLDPVI